MVLLIFGRFFVFYRATAFVRLYPLHNRSRPSLWGCGRPGRTVLSSPCPPYPVRSYPRYGPLGLPARGRPVRCTRYPVQDLSKRRGRQRRRDAGRAHRGKRLNSADTPPTIERRDMVDMIGLLVSLSPLYPGTYGIDEIACRTSTNDARRLEKSKIPGYTKNEKRLDVID